MRLKSFLDQLQVERGILDRMVYKNKNQHRRCSYFQYLLKVRSDLRLLQSARLEEILSSAFIVINGTRAKQKVQLLESLKRRKCDGRHNFLEQLLGAARLLSQYNGNLVNLVGFRAFLLCLYEYLPIRASDLQIVEPMLKAAMEISKVLARSFFMGFSLTIMALLARLRVLVQQILLDVVTVFKVASSLSRKEQSVFRDLYPANEQKAVYLECVWEADKFVLIESINKPENKDQVMDVGEDFSLGVSAIQYQIIDTLLREDEPIKLDSNVTSERGPSNTEEDDPSSLEGVANKTDSKPVGDGIKVEDFSRVAGTFSKNDFLTHPSSRSNALKLERGSSNKVAFISVKRPAPSTAR